MKKEAEKKGILARLTGKKKASQSPCCGGFVVEKIPEEKNEDDKGKDAPKEKRNSCCG
ncbi:MAG: hypothetical protein NT147_03275 [Candidatus Aminicenantes bacterium]|nr:hypothetical protein [Candidatus Aminicenantes bacterium]